MFIQLYKDMWVNPQFIAAFWKEPKKKRSDPQRYTVILNGGSSYFTEGKYAEALIKAKFPNLLTDSSKAK